MIELNEDTSPLAQLVGVNVNGLDESLTQLELYVRGDDAHMALGTAYRMREAAEHIMSMCSKRLDY